MMNSAACPGLCFGRFRLNYVDIPKGLLLSTPITEAPELSEKPITFYRYLWHPNPK
jgi:hypothetical protein